MLSFEFPCHWFTVNLQHSHKLLSFLGQLSLMAVFRNNRVQAVEVACGRFWGHCGREDLSEHSRPVNSSCPRSVFDGHFPSPLIFFHVPSLITSQPLSSLLSAVNANCSEMGKLISSVCGLEEFNMLRSCVSIAVTLFVPAMLQNRNGSILEFATCARPHADPDSAQVEK